MSDRWAVGLAIALGWIAIIVLRRKGERMREREAWQPPAATAPRGGTPPDEIDRATLEEAEREVRDLPPDLKGRHQDDALGEDWGPGTPKPPYV